MFVICFRALRAVTDTPIQCCQMRGFYHVSWFFGPLIHISMVFSINHVEQDMGF